MAASISSKIGGSFSADSSGIKAQFAGVIEVIQDTQHEAAKLGALLSTAMHTAEINKTVAAMHALQQETIAAAAAGQKKAEADRIAAQAADESKKSLAAHTGLAKNLALDAAKAVGNFFKDTLIAGVRFNAMLETTQLSLAAMLKSNNPGDYQTFDQALQRSTKILDQLKQKAAESPATFEQLVQTFQGSAGALAAAGVPMHRQIELVTQLSEAMVGMGISSQDMRQEVSALMKGTIDENDRLASTLHITDEEIARAKEHGKLFELITGKLNSMGAAGRTGAQSIAQLETKLKSTYLQTAAGTTKDLSNAYGELLRTLTDFVKSDAFKEWVEMLSSLTKGALEALQGFIIWLKGPEAGEGKERALAESSKNITSREEADSILKQGVPLLASLKKEQDAVERSKPIQAPTNLVWGLGGVGGLPDTRYAKYLESMENIGKRRNDLESAIAEAKTFIAKKGADATGQTGQSPQTSNQSGDQTGGGTPPLTGVPPPPPTTHPANDPDAERRKLEADRKRLEDERKQDAREAQNITQRFNLSQKQFEASIAAIRANPYISQKEKNELLNEKFREERNSLSGRLALANGMAQGEVDGSSRQAAYLAEGRRVEERQQAVGNDVDATDATTVFEDYEQGIAKLRSSFKSLGQSLADGVGSTMSSLSDHLGKLVMGTETWGQALNGIWHTFGQSMLRAFTDMVAQWAINKARMFAIDALFSMKSLALSAANAAKNLVLWIPSAIAASISSFGTAAAIGAAAVIAALAIKGFSEGGYTGSGGRLEPAGIVHRGEMVFSQADIARHGGVAAVEALRLSGGMSGRGAGVTASPSAGGVGGPAIGDGQAAVNIAYFNTRQNAETWLASQRGTRVLKDWMRDNRYDT